MILCVESPIQETGAIAGFSLRDPALPNEGNQSFAFGRAEAVRANRVEFCRGLGLDPSSVTLAPQEHGVTLHRIDREQVGIGASDPSSLPPADGLLTDVPGCAVGVTVADCCCLLMANAQGTAVGAFHAGWRGTLENMAGTAVKRFRNEFGIEPVDLRVWIGPAIGFDSYEVSQELWQTFRERWGPDRVSVSAPWRVDLPGLNRFQSLESGVPEEAIFDTGLCTLKSERCFSHRSGDRSAGRMLGLIVPEKSAEG